MGKNGVFVSLEGIDGAGKTTLRELLVSALNDDNIISIREPGGTTISEKIRAVLLDTQNMGMAARTEALLYAAARSQVVEEIIRPALAQGKLVLADRYMDSTIAYQGYGRGLDLEFLTQLNRLCTGGLTPDVTLLLDVAPGEGLRRRGEEKPDRLEQEGITFQEKVRQGYLVIAAQEPDRVKIIDAAQGPDEVLAVALGYLQGLIGG